MFIVTAKFSRHKALLGAVCLFLVIGLSAALFGHGRNAEEGGLVAESNEARIEYLHSLGWEVVPDPVETLSLTLPDPLVEPYLSYNELQRSQGFDLSDCCGKPLERYTYVVTNYPGRADNCQADLYLCSGVIVAGDIVCAGEDGFMAELAFPEKAS